VVNGGGGLLGGLATEVAYQGTPDGWLSAALSGETGRAELTLEADPGALGDGIYLAEVEVTSPDAVNGPQRVAVTFTVVPRLADLRVEKQGPVDVIAGEEAIYTLTVSNAGPRESTSVVLEDRLPEGVTFLSASPAEASVDGAVVTWPELVTLGAGASASYSAIVMVDPSTVGVITNTANVSAATPDPDGSNNTRAVQTTVTASADLAVEKGGPEAAEPGEEVIYTLTVSNAGPSEATGVVLTDRLPEGVTFSSATPAEASVEAGIVTWPELATLESGADASYSVVVRVDPSAAGGLTNTASVSAVTADPDRTNNTAEVQTTVGAVADLAVEKTGPDAAGPGDEVTYTLTVSNAGPSEATGVVLTDRLPEGVTFSSATPAEASVEAGVVTWPELATLKAGADASYSVVVKVDPGTTGVLTNSATVSAATPDPDRSNNTSEVQTTVGGSADLAVEKKGLDAARPGGEITYTLTVSSAGPSEATGVVLTDRLPEGVTFSSATPAEASVEEGVVTWPELATLKSGSSAAYSVVVTVDPGTTGVLTNSATVSAATPDPDGSNNTAEVQTTIGVSADLEVKTSGPKEAGQRTEISYAVSVTNKGPDPAADVVVTNAIPEGMSFLSATGTHSEANGMITWEVGDLASGASADYSVSVLVEFPESGETKVENQVAVTSGTPDPEGQNNEDKAQTEITGSADLEVKTSGPKEAVQGTQTDYGISVKNKGPDQAFDVILTNTIPEGMSFFSATGLFLESGGVVTWEVGTLAAGAVVEYTLTVLVDLSGEGETKVESFVAVSSNTPDPKDKNNEDKAKTTIIPGPGT
jgi:uncharacterized repeat protein (TIGR01451 family)